MTRKKKWLVDVPVKTNIWIRPDFQRRQFEVIKKARPSILFIQSDGGRNKEEWDAINIGREMFDKEIDWDCKVYKNYVEENLGLYQMGDKTQKLIWSNVDRCIFLEDDDIPSVSFFRFCAEMLEKYKDDTRIFCVCGTNTLGVYDKPESDYFFSRYGSIWGVAYWKRSYEQFNDFEYGKNKYVMDLLNKQVRKEDKFLYKRINGYLKDSNYDGHVAATEYFIDFAMYGHNQLQIIPKKNLINNCGCDPKSEHSNDIRLVAPGLRSTFNMKTYELDFPLKEAKYVIPDEYFGKRRNRIIGYNHPIVTFIRKIQCVFLYIRYGKFKEMLIKIKRNISPNEK